MYIYFDEDISSVKSVKKKIKIDGQEVADPAIIGNFGDFRKLPNGKFGFDYRAPEDFPADFFLRNRYEISLEVDVVDNNNKESHGYKTFIVMRPGVLLLHGLLGDDSAFEAQYKHLLTEGGYYPYQVLNASYKETNAQSFEDNTYCNDVVGNRLKALFDDYAKHGIISSKYDIVGHSMGGILARLYAQEVNPGAVNRIITLDTPHYGSQLADFREPVLEYAESKASSSSIIGVKRMCSFLVDEFSNPKYDAIENLQPSSNAIGWLNSKSCAGIPVHAIGSYMTKNVTSKEITISTLRFFLLIQMSFVLGCADAVYENTNDHIFSWMNDVYGGYNDGIVSLNSQLGGLVTENGASTQEAEYKGPAGFSSNAHHTNTHHWAQTIEYITNSLRLPKTSNRFSMTGFRAPSNALLESGGPLLVSMPEFKDAPETSFINLSLEKNEDEYDRDLVASVTKSDDIESFFIFACLDEDKCLVSAWDTEPTFVIPDNYEGNLVFYVLGRTANDELVADIDSVEFSSITSLAALNFEDYDDLTMCVGQTLGLNVIATWDNGESEYVKPTYSATPGGVLSIDGQEFTPVAVGECDLIAEYKGLTCTKKITVISGNVDPVEPLWGDVNLDGEVNIADINAVINIILMDTSSGMNGDVNGDSEVNIADVNTILNAILSY